MTIYKTVPVPDRGIDYQVKPHAIDPRAWTILDNFRTKNGTIRSFEGWNSILAAPLGEPILGLADFLKPLTLEKFFMLATADKVHAYDSVGGTVVDVTGAAVLSASMENPWSMVSFGDAVHMSSLNTDGMHRWDGTGTLVQIPDSPSFAFISTLNDYLMGLYERLGAEHYPYSIRWAAEGTDDQWIATETVDAGEFPLNDTPDIGVALYRLGNDLIAYKERTVIPITFIGGNDVFGRRAAVSGAGLIGPYALAQVGDRHIFMGQETFYSYVGGNVIDDSIGDSIRDLVYPNLNKALRYHIRTLNLRGKMEIVFFYPSLASEGGCDLAVVYNLKDGTWAGPMTIIDLVSFCANFSLDDTGSKDLVGTMTGNLLVHGTGYTENGVAQIRRMESGDLNLQTDATDENGNKVFKPLSMVWQVNVVNLDVEGVPAGTPARFWVGSRLDLNDAIDWQGPFDIVASSLQTIRVPVRRTGRWFRVKIECDADSEFALQNYQFEFEWVGNR